MIFILNKRLEVLDTLNNFGDLSKITPFYDDLYVQDLASGAETFSFSTLANTTQSQHLVVANYIAFNYKGVTKLFHIIHIEESHDETFEKKVYCEMAGIELINEIVRPMKVTNSNLRKLLDSVLAETDWKLGKFDASFTEIFDFEINDYSSVYSVIQEYAIKKYGAEISFRVEMKNNTVIGQYIDVYRKRGKDDGFRFDYTANISEITRKVDTSDLCTALIGVGKNNITFKEIETGDKPLNQDFIASESAYKAYNNNGSHIMGVFKADTESPQELLKLTREELDKRSKPKTSYELKVELLGREVNIGDTVYIFDGEFNPPIMLEGRVSQLKESFTDEGKNECILANFKEIKSNITDELRGMLESRFPIGTNDILNEAVTGDKISTQYTTTVIADAVIATKIEVEDLIADKASIKDLEVINASIENLKATDVEVTGKLTATNAEIENLKVKDAEITGKLTATNADIEKLKATDVDITGKLTAVEGDIGSLNAGMVDVSGKLTATEAEINLLKADVAEIDNIKSNVAEIEHVLAGNITADNIQAGSITAEELATGTITAGSGVIAEGAIGSAEISELDAGKISAGKINTNKVEVGGVDGHLRIKGNRIQVFNGKGSQAVERVSMGDVNGDGTIYGLRVRGADGQTILLDENGVKSEGITDGAITNDKISNNAEIDGSKLNINSVVDKINEDGTEVIKGTKIEVEGTNLTAKLSTITEKQEEDSNKITQNTTLIKANEDAIKLKVDEQTYSTDKEKMTSQLNKNTTSIDVMKDQIALKVEQTDITNALDKLVIGGRNLLVDSNRTVGEDSSNEFVQFADIAPIIDANGLVEYTISFDLKSKNVSQNDTIRVYLQNGSGSKYHFEPISINATEEFERYSITAIPMESDLTQNKAMLAFFGTYGTGNVPVVKRVKVELGNKATDWTPAPEDMSNEIDSKVQTAKAEIKLTTDGIKQSVTKLESSVSNKADGTTVTNLTNKVGSLETSVNSIKGEVSSLEKTTTTIDNKVNDNKGSITNIQGEVTNVKSNVANLVVDLNGITQRVSNTEKTTTTLTNNLNGAIDKANQALETAGTANDKIDNLKIGGRNLILNSGQFIEGTNLISKQVGGLSIDKNDLINKVVTVSVDVELVEGVLLEGQSNRLGYEMGLTLEDDTSFYIGSWLSIRSGMNYKNKITRTITVPDKGIKSINYSGIYIQCGATKAKVGFPKIEFGTKATDWTPAPEDVNNALNDIDVKVETTKSQMAEIATSLDSITQRVSSTESTTTTLTSQMGAVDGKIDLAKNQAIADARGIKDTRNDNENPGWYFSNYPKQSITEFKYARVVGIPGATGHAYGVTITNVPWADSSGGYPVQTFRSNSYPTYQRVGVSNDAWGDWKQVEDTEGSQSKADNALNEAKSYTTAEVSKTNNRVSEIVTDLNGITQRVSNTEKTTTTLTNNLETTTNKVNEANEKIDNLKIGTRNYYLKKSFGANNVKSATYNERLNEWTVVINPGSGLWRGIRYTSKNVIIHPGETVTVSYEVLAPISIPMHPDVNNLVLEGPGTGNDNDDPSKRVIDNTPTVPNKWCKRYFQYAISDSKTTDYYDNSVISIGDVNLESETTIKIRNIQFEKGNKITDFTYAPEDIQANIDNIQIGGRNLLRNTNFYKHDNRNDLGWDNALNGNYVANYWSFYNGGVSNPNTGYHAHLFALDGELVVRYMEQVGRWQSASYSETSFKDRLQKGVEYTYSFEIKGDTLNSEIFGGFYYYRTGESNPNFHMGQYSFVVKETGKWIKHKYTFTLPDDIDLTKNVAIYNYGEKSKGVTYARKFKLEKGNKTTDWTPSDLDTQDQLDVNKTEITNTKNQVATINTDVGRISSRVGAVETTVERQGNASSQNLLYNADFRILNGNNADEWIVADTNRIKLDTISTLLDGCSSYYFNVTGLTGDEWLALYSPFIQAKPYEKFTASIYVIIVDSNSFDRGAGLEIEYFNSSDQRIKTNTAGFDYNRRGWQRIVLHGVAPEGTVKVRIRVHPVRNGKFNVSKPMLQLGEVATGWEKGFDINNLTTRLKTAESKITKESITNTVKESFYSKSDIDSKGYQTQSQVQQTVNGLEIKISESGGYNLLKNGCGKKGVYFWEGNGGGCAVNNNDPNYPSYFNSTLPNGITGQWVKLKNDTTYIYSSMLWSQNSYSGSSITPMHYWCSATQTAGQSQCDVVKYQQRLVANKWNEVYVVIKTKPAGDVWFKPFIYANDASGDISITNLMLCEGSILLPYSPNPDEVYDGITSIDKDGITVKNSSSDTYTQIDTSSFSVNDNNGGTVAEFSRTSLIPNLNCPGTLNAGTLYANNIPTRSTVNNHNYWTTYYVQGNYGNDNNPGTGWGNSQAFKTLEKALSMIPTIVNQNYRIRVGGSVSGAILLGRFGSGQIELLLEDDCVVNTAIDIVGCTCMVQVYGNYDTKKGTLKQGICINNCTSFDIGWLSFRGANWGTSESCNIFICNKSMGIVRCNDFNGVSNAVTVNSSNVWFFGNQGSAVTNYIGIANYANIYMMLTGQDICPDYTGYMYSNAGHANMYHIFEGASFKKTPSVGWNPSYTPTQRTSTWNFNNIWSDETLNGWSNKSELIQGYYSGWNTGRWTGYMQMHDGFAEIRNTISGATNLSGRIYVQRRTSSGNSTGSKLHLYGSDGTLITNSTSIDRGQGVWVPLSGSIIQKIQSGAITYFYLRADSNNASTYFKCESNPKIEITYTK